MTDNCPFNDNIAWQSGQGVYETTRTVILSTPTLWGTSARATASACVEMHFPGPSE